VGVTWASPDYFTTLGIRLVRGRWFTDRDREGQPKVCRDQRNRGAALLAERGSDWKADGSRDRAVFVTARR
jgi:hypothetical protein